MDSVTLIEKALTPDLSGNEQVREMRAQEVRRAIFNTDLAGRASFVMELGKRAALEGILAAESCPLGRMVEPEILRQAKHSALESMGVEFLLEQVVQRSDVLRALAARCDWIEDEIRGFLNPHGVKPAAPVSWIRSTAKSVDIRPL